MYLNELNKEKYILIEADNPNYQYSGRIFMDDYRKLRKIIELRDWQPPAVCDNICVGTFINFENR